MTFVLAKHITQRINYLENKEAQSSQKHELGIISAVIRGPLEQLLNTSGKYESNPKKNANASEKFDGAITSDQSSIIGANVPANYSDSKSPAKQQPK